MISEMYKYHIYGTPYSVLTVRTARFLCRQSVGAVAARELRKEDPVKQAEAAAKAKAARERSEKEVEE